jgi:hypothetical protein
MRAQTAPKLLCSLSTDFPLRPSLSRHFPALTAIPSL